MNRDDIIDWVTQVDMAFLKRIEPWNMFDKYEAFAKLVAQHEREACADIAEKQRYAMLISLTSHPAQNGTAVGIANQIRARGEA